MTFGIERGTRVRRLACTVALLLVTAPLASACDAPGVTKACTLIGCTSGLTVQLPSRPVGAFTVEVLAEGTPFPGVAYTYRCDGGPGCSDRIAFPGLLPTRAAVRVTTASGTRTTEVMEVRYVESFPNGRDCAPRCLQGTIDALLPA